MSLIARFWSKIVFIPFHACWEWAGTKNEKGYGIISIGRRDEGRIRAHRLSWELANGPIPEGLIILHACDNPSCVRPEHLKLGTNKDNTQDMISKKRGRGHFSSGVLDSRASAGRHNRIKIQCPKGHPYDEENTYRVGNRRNCKLCQKLTRQASRLSKRLKVAA